MDFNDSPEEADFRTEVRSFLDQHARPLPPGEIVPAFGTPENEDDVKRSQEWQATKYDNGWACLTWPRAHGGQDSRPIQQVIWNQEETRYRTPANIFTIGIGMLGPTLMAHGTQEQKAAHLHQMARGDNIWCQLFSEPSAGSDLAGLRTRSVRQGSEWIVNGQKTWTSGAHYSKYGLVITRSDPHQPKHKGLTYFIVDMESEGIEVRQIRQVSGAANFNEVFFSDVRIPDSNRVGEVNDGWRGAITTLMNERATIGARGLGGFGPETLLRLAMDIETPHGNAIEDSGVRQRIADFYVKTSGLKYTSYRTLTAISKGGVPGPENSIGKMIGGPLRQQMASFGMELQGMASSLMDASFECQQTYLASPGGRIAGGSDEIMRNIVAERVLGLPPEPRADKDGAFNEIPAGSR